MKTTIKTDEGKKHVEKVEVETHNVDTVKYIERKLTEKGVQRLERHPADGLPLKHEPKKGHGGKYTWEGPEKAAENPAPPALDEKDPNYVEEENEDATENDGVVGKVEVAKIAEKGVARIEVDPHLKPNYNE